MFFDPENLPGVGQLYLIGVAPNEDFRREHDKIFEDVEGLSSVYCALHGELLDAYRIWDIYGIPYTSHKMHLAGQEREEYPDLLALWTEVLILRTVRLTDKSKRHKPVSVFQFLELDLEADLKKEVEDLIKITEDKTKPLRTARDKFFAHKDFDVVEGKVSVQKPGFTIHDIAEILESVGDILIHIYNYYTKSDTYISFNPGYPPLDKVKY